MMTKIWARRSSSSAQKVYWTLAELGVEHEQINAGAGYGIVDEPSYRAKNPNGLVPTLEEADGFTLWESNAIVRYLADRYGKRTLQPAGPRQKAKADSWMDWTTTTLEPAISALWVRLVLQWDLPHRPPNEDLIATATGTLQLLAGQIPPGGYSLGDSLTMGDIPLGVLVNRWFRLPIEHPDIPEIRHYYERLSERAPYRDHVMATRPLV